MEVALVSVKSGIETFPLSDTSFITISGSYHYPNIAKFKLRYKERNSCKLNSDCKADEKKKPTNFSESESSM